MEMTAEMMEKNGNNKNILSLIIFKYKKVNKIKYFLF